MIEQVFTRNGLKLPMVLIKKYPKGKLFFFQERLCITDLSNKEMLSNDIIDLVEEIL